MVFAPLAVRRADAVRSGVAAADDDHVLALGGECDFRIDGVAGDALVLLRQKLHRVVDAGEVAAFAPRGHAAWSRRPTARWRRTRDRARRPSRPCRRRRSVRKTTPSASICVDAPVDVVLLHLEVGDAVAQQAADAIVALEHGDVVTGARQLLSAGEPGRPRADHGDLAPGTGFRAAAARRGRASTLRR